MRFKDWPMAARIWSAIAVTMVSFTTAAVVALWQNDGAPRGAPWMLIVALAVAALISGLAGWFVANGIVKPFHKAVDIAVAIARGQLDNPIRADTRDELGWLLHELKQMQKSLAGSVTGIRTAADAINAAAGDIASASANLSARTETQAASLQQAGWAVAAIACSCAQHGFTVQEPMLAMAGKAPVIVRIATAMSRVRMTIANPCMMAAIPNCRRRLTSAREDIHSGVPPTRGGLPA